MQKNFLCPRCFKTFDRKSNFARHLNRLTSCIRTKKNKDIISIQVDDFKKYVKKNYPDLNDNIVSDIIGENIPVYEEKKYSCDYCGKSFKSQTYFRKHLEKMCSRNLRFEQQLIVEKIRRIEKFKKENLDLKERIYNSVKTLPRFYVEEGKVVNVEKNFLQYYQLKNIRIFGNEIMDHINDMFMRKMIMNPEVGIIKLIKDIHFNIEIPQNRNVFVKSKKFNNIEVYRLDGWKTLPRKDVFQNIIATKKDIMDEYFESFRENNDLDDKYIYKYESFSNCLDNYINYLVFNPAMIDHKLKKSKQIYERLCKELNLLFINNQKIEVTYTPESNINVSGDNIEEKVKNILEEVEIVSSEEEN